MSPVPKVCVTRTLQDGQCCLTDIEDNATVFLHFIDFAYMNFLIGSAVSVCTDITSVKSQYFLGSIFVAQQNLHY